MLSCCQQSSSILILAERGTQSKRLIQMRLQVRYLTLLNESFLTRRHPCSFYPIHLTNMIWYLANGMRHLGDIFQIRFCTMQMTALCTVFQS
jgi:hypothetical protein